MDDDLTAPRARDVVLESVEVEVPERDPGGAV
jgi:hypothetical protein